MSIYSIVLEIINLLIISFLSIGVILVLLLAIASPFSPHLGSKISRNKKIEVNEENNWLFTTFNSYKTTEGLKGKDIRLAYRKCKAHTGYATYYKISVVEISTSLLNLINKDIKDEEKAYIKKIIGHELSHIKNKDNINIFVSEIIVPLSRILNKNYWTEKKAVHILREIRCDIEGCHDIAKLNNTEIEQAFDYYIQYKYKKPIDKISKEEIENFDKKEMKMGYLSYSTRKRLTLKYKKVNEEMVEEVLNIFFEHFTVKNKEELTKELIAKFISETEVERTT